jgi:hypothetical protein
MARLAGANAISPGEDLGQCIDQAASFLSPATSLLEGQEVHAPVQETSVIGQLGLDRLGQIPTRAKLFEGQAGQIGYELGLSNLVDSAAFGHGCLVIRQVRFNGVGLGRFGVHGVEVTGRRRQELDKG